MKKRIISLLLVCVMLFLCSCEANSGKGDIPANENVFRETEVAQEPVHDEGDEETEPAVVTTARIEGSGFDSPEEAILAYVEALQQGDVQKILSSFAIETYVEHFDLAAYIKNWRFYSFSYSHPLPNADAYTAELNKYFRLTDIVTELAYMYMSFTDAGYDSVPIPLNGNPYDNAEALVDDLSVDNWNQIWADMKIGRVLTFEDLFESSERLQESLKNRCQELGCEELVPLAVEITLDGDRYYISVDVACYNGRWYNCDPSGTIAAYLGADVISGGLYP